MLNVVVNLSTKPGTAAFLLTKLAGQDATENVRHLTSDNDEVEKM